MGDHSLKKRGTTTPHLKGRHNLPLPQAGEKGAQQVAGPRGDKFHPKMDSGSFLEPRGGGGAPPPSAELEDTCKVIFQRGERDHNHPGQLGGHEVTALPQTGHKGASHGLGLWPAQGGGEQRRGATSGGPPLTGASSGAPGNPARGGRTPRRRLHGRASSEVT